MNAPRLLALLLIIVQAAALGLLARTILFPITICIVAIAACWTPWRLTITRERMMLIGGALLVAFLVRYRLAPPKLSSDLDFARTPLTHTLAQYFLSLQALLLFVRWDGGRLPVFFPALGVVALISAANIHVNSLQRTAFQGLTVAFVVLAALYFGACRRVLQPSRAARPRLRTAVGLTVLVAACSVGVSGATFLHQHERDLERLVARLLDSSRAGTTGFSGEGSLGGLVDHKLLGSDRVALRVSCEDQPGYLRGKAFAQLESYAWESLPSHRIVHPRADAPEGLVRIAASEPLFELRNVQSRRWTGLRCWPEASLPRIAFAPMGSTHLETNADYITTGVHDTFNVREAPAGRPYTVYRPHVAYTEQLSEAKRERLTDVPGRLRRRFQRLADSVFENCRSTQEKIAAVERYFHENYEYELGYDVADHEDPLVYFLAEKPAAHCEFFASGAAVLLRLSGVPCRYVTGFVVSERNTFGDYWVARNRDAHSWVEAFDEERGWTIVEATPGEGVPRGSASALRQFWEALRDRASMAWISLRHGGLISLAAAVADWLTPVRVALLMAGIGLILLLKRRVRPHRTNRLARDGRLAGLHRLLNRMDARVSRLGLRRAPGETLHQFAERVGTLDAQAHPGFPVEAVREWYLQYAAVRYSNPSALTALREPHELLAGGRRA